MMNFLERILRFQYARVEQIGVWRFEIRILLPQRLQGLARRGKILRDLQQDFTAYMKHGTCRGPTSGLLGGPEGI